LRNAIQKINDCPHSGGFPVLDELQKQQIRHAEHTDRHLG
jgi:hypothetical protein